MINIIHGHVIWYMARLCFLSTFGLATTDLPCIKWQWPCIIYLLHAVIVIPLRYKVASFTVMPTSGQSIFRTLPCLDQKLWFRSIHKSDWPPHSLKPNMGLYNISCCVQRVVRASHFITHWSNIYCHIYWVYVCEILIDVKCSHRGS